MKNRKKALVTLALAIALVPILALTVTADTSVYNFQLNIANYIPGSSSVLMSGSNITDYTLSELGWSNLGAQWPLGDHAFKATMNVNTWDPPSDELYTVFRISYSCSFDVSSYLLPADERYLVFTVLSKLQSTTYEYPTEDSSLTVNGVAYTPYSITNSSSGRSYTYLVDKLNMSDGTLKLTFNYGDFSAQSLGRQLLFFFQSSEIAVYSTLSAAAQHAQAIENLIENDIAPSLENIEDLMDRMNGQQAALNSQVSDLKDAVDELPGQVGEEIDSALKDQGAAEHSFGLQEGNQQVQDALGALPNADIDQAGSVLERLANAISTDKRSSRFDIPEIYIPELKSASGEVLMEKLTLIEARSFYWEDAIDQFVPPVLLIVVRAVITLGLGMYVFFELFRFIGMFSSPGGEG